MSSRLTNRCFAIKVYCGLLEKCPAISVVDVTVIDESTGTTVRRHEIYFQFDAGRYQEWVAELAVWLEDEDGGGRYCADR